MCPGEMQADLDPDAPLGLNMTFIWRCAACGHAEVRSDEFSEDAAV